MNRLDGKDRIQTDVRLEKRLVKVLKAMAELYDLSLAEFLEDLVRDAYAGRPLRPGGGPNRCHLRIPSPARSALPSGAWSEADRRTTMLSRYEHGRQYPSLPSLVKILRTLGCSAGSRLRPWGCLP
ncbi:MAG: helix-turn-helix domain-containing protein [Acidobacteriota bacterium]|nr:helix-turn-helix domain-containing protein [Acidobacteriota bacterium]